MVPRSTLTRSHGGGPTESTPTRRSAPTNRTGHVRVPCPIWREPSTSRRGRYLRQGRLCSPPHGPLARVRSMYADSARQEVKRSPGPEWRGSRQPSSAALGGTRLHHGSQARHPRRGTNRKDEKSRKVRRCLWATTGRKLSLRRHVTPNAVERLARGATLPSPLPRRGAMRRDDDRVGVGTSGRCAASNVGFWAGEGPGRSRPLVPRNRPNHTPTASLS
jgi:hypothetical protein